MKKSLLILLSLVLLSSVLLSACTGAGAVTSWPGLTVKDDVAYVAYGSHVYAVNYGSGTEIWRYPKEASATKLFFAAPAVLDGLVIAGDYEKELFGLSATTGAENWKFADATNRFIGAPLALTDSVLTVNADGNLFALDKSGKQLWKFAAGQPLWSHPVLDQEVIYLAGLNHTLFALDPGTGKLIWKQDVGSAMVSSPLVGTDGNLYISTFAKEVQARDAKNGKLLWTVKLEAEIWGTPVMDGDLLFVGDQKGNIYSISITNRSFKKIDTLDSAVIASPVMVKDHVVFVSENGEVAGYKPDGSAPWKQKITGKIYTTPVFNGELLIVAVKDGDKLLVMYDSDGKEVRSFAPAK